MSYLKHNITEYEDHHYVVQKVFYWQGTVPENYEIIAGEGYGEDGLGDNYDYQNNFCFFSKTGLPNGSFNSLWVFEDIDSKKLAKDTKPWIKKEGFDGDPGFIKLDYTSGILINDCCKSNHLD